MAEDVNERVFSALRTLQEYPQSYDLFNRWGIDARALLPARRHERYVCQLPCFVAPLTQFYPLELGRTDPHQLGAD